MTVAVGGVKVTVKVASTDFHLPWPRRECRLARFITQMKNLYGDIYFQDLGQNGFQSHLRVTENSVGAIVICNALGAPPARVLAFYMPRGDCTTPRHNPSAAQPALDETHLGKRARDTGLDCASSKAVMVGGARPSPSPITLRPPGPSVTALRPPGVLEDLRQRTKAFLKAFARTYKVVVPDATSKEALVGLLMERQSACDMLLGY